MVGSFFVTIFHNSGVYTRKKTDPRKTKATVGAGLYEDFC